MRPPSLPHLPLALLAGPALLPALTASCGRPLEAAPAPRLEPAAKLPAGTVRLDERRRTHVRVEEAASQVLARTLEAPARIAFRDGAVSEVGAPIGGRVSEVHVLLGELVTAGQAVVTMSSPGAAVARAELEAARCSVKAAEEGLRRQELLRERGVGLESAFLDAELRLVEARAELAAAEFAAAYLGDGEGTALVVRAPQDGTVLRRRATVGAAFEPGGEPLCEIGDPSALWVVADVFERDLSLLFEGTAAQVDIPALGRSVAARVVAVGASLSDGLRRAPVYLELEEDGLPLRPGSYARARLEGRASEGIALPASAVLIKEGKRRVVYVEGDDGLFHQRAVVVGPSLSGMVPVLEGLGPGERVAVDGALLIDGSADQLL